MKAVDVKTDYSKLFYELELYIKEVEAKNTPIKSAKIGMGKIKEILIRHMNYDNSKNKY